jgi:hypothetical protein
LKIGEDLLLWGRSPETGLPCCVVLGQSKDP